MSYTLGQAAKAVGMSKTSILRSIKAARISAGRDEFGQWAIEPRELHRVYAPLTDDTVILNRFCFCREAISVGSARGSKLPLAATPAPGAEPIGRWCGSITV